MGSDLRLEYNATGYVPTALDKAAFYGVQVNQDLFDPVKSRYVPAGSDSMMPVVKDPLISGQGKTENVVRQVFVVPFSSDRPAAATSTPPASTGAPPAQTPEMQEEMRKLVDAARAAVADLRAAAPPPVAEGTAPTAPAGQAGPAYQPGPAYQGGPAYTPEQGAHASQALEAATAMARATTALGQLAAASSGFSGMLPTVHAEEGTGPAGASRRIQAVMESLVSRRSLNLRLAAGLTQAFEAVSYTHLTLPTICSV